MKIITTEQIEESVYRAFLRAGKRIVPAYKAKLADARTCESNPRTVFALDFMIRNAELAEEKNLPVCQDTGVACVFLEIGQEVHIEGDFIEDAVNRGVRRAYQDGFFRKSVVDPLTRKNTQDNTPAACHYEIVTGDKLKITVLPKGFGSENMSKLYMLSPTVGREGIVRAVVDTVRQAGSLPCPPVVVGVGVGGTFDTCAFLAKKALLCPTGQSTGRSDADGIAEECLAKINELRIGAQGFGGAVSALDVRILTAPTHIAGLPVAVNIQCHCMRCEEEIL